MPLRMEDKQAVVAEVNEVAVGASSAVTAEYRGLSVAQMTAFRKKARDTGVYVRVIKNTLARRAVAGTEFECLRDAFKGPLVLAFSRDDPGAAARLVKDFAKENERLVATAVAIGGQVYAASDLDRLASLPTLDQARAMLLGVLQGPLSQLVRTLAEPPAMLARTLQAYGEQQAA